MPKKSTTGKARPSTSKARAKSRQTTKARSVKQAKQASSARAKRSRGETAPEEPERRMPLEHYRGERGRGTPAVEPGSLEEETLDRDAPYNRTYGR